MTADQLRARLAALGLTMGHAARLCGVADRTMRHWCQGDRPVPEPVVRLLTLAGHGPIRRALEAMAEGEAA